MPEYTIEFLQERLAALPETIREQMMSLDTARTVEDIGEKHRLHIDQIGELSDEVGLVLLGLTRTSDFVAHIAKRTGIDMATANAVATEVDTVILKPIKASLIAFTANVAMHMQDEQTRTIPVKSDGYREPIDQKDIAPVVGKVPMPAVSATTNHLPKREDLLREIEGEHKPSISASFPTPTPSFASAPPSVSSAPIVAPVPPTAPQAMGTATPIPAKQENVPPLVKVAGMTSVPQVKDLIHEKPVENDDTIIKQKLAGTFSLGSTKTTSDPQANTKSPLSEAPKKTGHDPYREPIK